MIDHIDYNEIDWTQSTPNLFRQIEEFRQQRILANIRALDGLREQLEKQDIFNHQEFKKIRRRTGSQQDWADLVGVSQATIGNYERNITYPNKSVRQLFIPALQALKEEQSKNLKRAASLKLDVDAADAKAALDSTILNAALTDLRFDPDEQRVIQVPFNSDWAKFEIDSIEQDRADLLQALAAQAADLRKSLGSGVNANVGRMVDALESYQAEVESARPNPRKLFRLGSNIYRGLTNDDISFALSEWDKASFDGFVEDHTELMRLYFREALAKAQQVEALAISDSLHEPSAEDFNAIADTISSIKDADGVGVFADDIPTLLKDIARDVEENRVAELLSGDDAKKKALRKRRFEAVKQGSILVGRILFFAAFFIAVDPAVALGTAANVAAVMGVLEQAAPGSVRRYYEKLREMLPFLPKFPSSK